MSFDRLVLRDSRDPSPGQATGNPAMSRKLPPLVPGHGPEPVMAGRSMHQIQLEMEYDAEEADHRGRDGGHSVHSWPRGQDFRAGSISENEGEGQATREILALCIFDSINLPQSALPTSPLIEALCRYPVVRRWGRWRWRERPAYSNVQVGEAIALHERGLEKTIDRCNRCRAGQGISPQCVIVPAGFRWSQQGDSGPCSNCLYDGAAHACNASSSRSPLPQRRDRNPDVVVDQLAVLEMIAQLQTPSGSSNDSSLPGKAARIEAAALRIAQAAREWGDKIAKEG